MKRRRPLSEAEKRDWAKVAASVTARPGTPPVPAPAAEVPAVHPAAPPKPPKPPKPPRAPVPGPSSHQLDGKTESRLRRGRLHPDDRIDLHGLSAEAAHRQVTGFLAAAHGRGLRLVLVITGKGRPSRGGQGDTPAHGGVLRHALPHWLAAPGLRPFILLVQPAHDRHGGGGAFYVYLRRRRGVTSAEADRWR